MIRKYDLNSHLPDRRLDPPDKYPADEDEKDQADSSFEELDAAIAEIKENIECRDWPAIDEWIDVAIKELCLIRDLAEFASKRRDDPDVD